jgi:hypothetical protein
MGQLVRGAPGVYVKGLPSEPVLPLSAITGFVGIAERGPLHHPEPIRTWDEYLTVFGDLLDHAFLPHAVFGFFRNGGRRCFVVRVADLTDSSAQNAPLRCPRVDLLASAKNILSDADGNPTIAISAINEGRWGNRLRFELQPGSQRNMPLTTLTATAPAGTTTLPVAEPFDLRPTPPPMPIRLAPPGDPFGGRQAVVQAVSATGVVTLAAALDVDMPRGTVVLGQGFKLVVTLADKTEVFDNLSLSPSNPRYFVTVVNGRNNDVPYIERQALGSSILVKVAPVAGPPLRFRPVPSGSAQALSGGGDGFRYAEAAFVNSIRVVACSDAANVDALGAKGNLVRVKAEEFATKTALAAAAGASAIVVENSGGLVSGDTLTLTGANPPVTESQPIATVGADNTVTLNTGPGGLTNSYPLGSKVTVQNRFTLSVFRRAADLEPAEVHRNLSGVPATPRYFRTRLATPSSKLLCGDGPDVVVPAPAGEITLSGGRDPGGIDLRWYTGYDGAGQYFVPPGQPVRRRYGLASLESVEEIDLVAVPDLAGQAIVPPNGTDTADVVHLLGQRQMLFHAARLGDRIALLDTRAKLAATTATTAILDVAKVPQQLADPLTTKFGALYFPWLKVAIDGGPRLVPPSGFVAGLIARADAEGGVGRAPANFPLKDAVDLEVMLEAPDQDTLNPAGVNAVRKFEAPALELWGARTLSSDPAARYLNVRRLLIAIKKAIGRTLLWTVFEPNGPVLRRRIQASLESLMLTLVTAGATPATGEAFFVRCDETNNPPELVDAGQVVATIGVALVAPAEFIVLNVKRTPDAISVTEEAS